MIIIIGCNGTYRHWSDNERILSVVWTEVKYSHNYYQIIANYLQLICKPCTDRSPNQPAVHKHQHSTHCRLITDHIIQLCAIRGLISSRTRKIPFCIFQPDLPTLFSLQFTGDTRETWAQTSSPRYKVHCFSFSLVWSEEKFLISVSIKCNVWWVSWW